MVIDEIQIISNHLRSSQSQAESHNAGQLNEHFRLLTNILVNQATLHSLLQTQRQAERPAQVLVSDTAPVPGGYSSNRIVSVRAFCYQRSPCSSHCKCACHEVHTFQTPSFFNQVIGSLFVGYSGYPRRMGTSPRCTEAGCLSRSISRIYIHYCFPFWLLAKAVMFGLKTQSLGAISLSLTIRPIILNSSELFRLAGSSDVKGIQQLFSKGLASPNDCSEDGYSALYVRLSHFPTL